MLLGTKVQSLPSFKTKPFLKFIIKMQNSKKLVTCVWSGRCAPSVTASLHSTHDCKSLGSSQTCVCKRNVLVAFIQCSHMWGLSKMRTQSLIRSKFVWSNVCEQTSTDKLRLLLHARRDCAFFSDAPVVRNSSHYFFYIIVKFKI